ncbi:MAG: rod shape-determining protein MreC [Lautropia sp.]
MDRSPPPFFRQGPSANARAFFFAVLSIALMIADARFDALSGLRQGIGNALYPMQKVVQTPGRMIGTTTDYVAEVASLRDENAELRRIEALNANTLLQVEQLRQENAQLRELVGARERAPVHSVVAEVMFETRDAFTNRLVLDKGQHQKIAAGQPVIDASGLVGQVTRVFQFSSEMTLVTDRDIAVPVQVQRTGMRTVAFGGAPGARMELRYLAANADVRPGDLIVTSGLDRLYPAGVPVGRIASIDRGDKNDLIKVLVDPIAAVRNSRLLVILQVDTSGVPPMPAPDGAAAARRRKTTRER